MKSSCSPMLVTVLLCVCVTHQIGSVKASLGGLLPPLPGGSGSNGSLPQCRFPAFEWQRPPYPSGLSTFCSGSVAGIPAMNQSNLCICGGGGSASAQYGYFPRLVGEQCGPGTVSAFFALYLDAMIEYSVGVSNPTAAATLRGTLGLTAAVVVSARLESCSCLKKLRPVFGFVNASSQMCNVMITGSGRVSASTYFLNNNMNGSCPQVGCCSGAVRLRRNLTSTATESVSVGGVIPQTSRKLCDIVQSRMNASIATCLATPMNGYARVSSSSLFDVGDPSCLARLASMYANSVERIGSRIRNFSYGMCNQQNIYDRSCVRQIVSRANLSRFSMSNVNGRAVITVNVNTSIARLSFEASASARVRVKIPNLRDRIGEIGARGSNSDCEMESNDTNTSATGDVDYMIAAQGGRILNRLAQRVRVFIRLDQDGGDLESNSSASSSSSRGDIECVGVYTSRANSSVRNSRLILRNVAALEGRWSLGTSQVECDSDFLLNGVVVSGDASSTISCTTSSGVILGGRASTNVIGVSTRTQMMEIDNGTMHISASTVVTGTLTTRRGAVLMVSAGMSLVVETSQGEGETTLATGASLEVNGGFSGTRLNVGGQASFRIRPRINTTRANQSVVAVLTTISGLVNVASQGVVEVRHRAASFSSDVTFAAGAQLRVFMANNDGFDGTVSIALRFDASLACAFSSASDIVVEVEDALMRRLNNAFVLARWARGSAAFPSSVTVVTVTTISGGRRRLATTTCSSTAGGNALTVDCSASGGSTTTTTTTTTPNPAPTAGARSRFGASATVCAVLVALGIGWSQ